MHCEDPFQGWGAARITACAQTEQTKQKNLNVPQPSLKYFLFVLWMFHIFLQYILIIPPNAISFQCPPGPYSTSWYLISFYVLVLLITSWVYLMHAHVAIGHWLEHELPVAISPKERPSLSQQLLTVSRSSPRSGTSGPFSIRPGIYTGLILCRSLLLLVQ